MMILHGKVNGRSIVFSENLGLSDGQEVEVQVRALPKGTQEPGDGFLRTEGALVDDAEWDDIMKEVHRARKVERRTTALDSEEP